jgi:hypothetical protein
MTKKSWYILTGTVAAVCAIIVCVLALSDKATGTTKTDHELLTAVQAAPDSGVVTCQEMADRANTTGPKPKLSYADVKAKFAASTDVEIRNAGMTLIDTMQKVEATVDNDDATPAESMGAILALRLAWTELQDACGKHGVTVPNLKA